MLFTYESDSLYAAQAEAHKMAFGQAGLPRTEYNKSEVIVGIGSDLLERDVYSAKSFSQSQTLRYVSDIHIRLKRGRKY